MKISKLFHWLYGLLMLLPCFAILVKCCYVAFNKNAYESYSGNEITYTQKTLQTNEVNNFSDLVEGNVYMFTRMDKNNNFSLCEYEDISGYLLHFQNCYLISGIDNYISSLYIDDYYLSDNFLTENYFEFMLSPLFDEEAYSFSIIVPFYQESYIVIGCDGYKTFDYIIFTYDTNCFIDFSTSSEQSILVDFISACPSEYLPLTTYYEAQETSTLDNVFYYAVDEVTSNELFSWASNSFLNAPLTYITNLFNMPSDNAIILLLSYWFNISIIWLVFDVMIYVPLLAHRWLDKGIIE